MGFDESMEMDVISQAPQFIGYCVDRLDAAGTRSMTYSVWDSVNTRRGKARRKSSMDAKRP